MTDLEMRQAVAELPSEYLRNYTSSFEAGIVGPFPDCRYCVVACIGNPATVTDMKERTRGYLAARVLLEGQRLEVGHQKTADNAAFRVALYDACTLELAARSRVELPATVEAL